MYNGKENRPCCAFRLSDLERRLGADGGEVPGSVQDMKAKVEQFRVKLEVGQLELANNRDKHCSKVEVCVKKCALI